MADSAKEVAEEEAAKEKAEEEAAKKKADEEEKNLANDEPANKVDEKGRKKEKSQETHSLLKVTGIFNTKKSERRKDQQGKKETKRMKRPE